MESGLHQKSESTVPQFASCSVKDLFLAFGGSEYFSEFAANFVILREHSVVSRMNEQMFSSKKKYSQRGGCVNRKPIQRIAPQSAARPSLPRPGKGTKKSARTSLAVDRKSRQDHVKLLHM